jgi:hypothetical protein
MQGKLKRYNCGGYHISCDQQHDDKSPCTAYQEHKNVFQSGGVNIGPGNPERGIRGHVPVYGPD